MRNEKTPLGSNSTRSVSYHHFWWAFASSAKSGVDKVRPIALKTRFFVFPHRGETKKHPRDRIPRGLFHTTILGGLSQASKKAGLTKVVRLRSKLVNSTFPIGGIEKTPLGSNSTRSVSYYYFGWAFASSAKSQVDEVPPIVFKTRFFDFPHRGEWKKHPWDRIPRGRFHTTILGELLEAAKKAGLTKVVQLRSKLVFFDFPNRGETKKHPLDQIPRGRFHTTILGELFEAAKKAGLTKVVQLRSKLVFSTFPIGAKRKNTLWIKFHEVGFIRPFWVGFSQQRKKPG